VNKGTRIVVVVILVVVGYVAVGPFLTIEEIKSGIVERDEKKLSDNIEFEILKENLKKQFNTGMIRKSASKMKDNFFSGLVAGLVSTAMVDPIVDSFVTSNGIASILEGKELSRLISGNTKKTSQKKDDLLKNAEYSYDSMNTFSVRILNDEGKETRIVLKRYGFSWKLVNIIVPIGKNF